MMMMMMMMINYFLDELTDSTGLPADLENLEFHCMTWETRKIKENFLKTWKIFFLTWNFPFNQNLKIKIVSFNQFIL